MTTERISFSGSQGADLSARVDRPVHGQPRGWALMVLHSPRDETVGIENAGRLFGYARRKG